MYVLNQEGLDYFHQTVVLPYTFFTVITASAGFIILFITILLLILGEVKKWWTFPNLIKIPLFITGIFQLFFVIAFILFRLNKNIPPPPAEIAPVLMFFVFLAPLLLFIFHIAWRTDIHLRLRYLVIVAYLLLLLPAAAAIGYAVGVGSISPYFHKVETGAQP